MLEVPWEEASRFGIMTADADGTITKFEEKPKQPQSNLASMGIYVSPGKSCANIWWRTKRTKPPRTISARISFPICWQITRRWWLGRLTAIGKNVGTIDSLWEANMDLLDPNQPLDMWDPAWKIYSRTSGRPGTIFAPQAHVDNCMITEGCVVEGNVSNSVLFANVRVAQGAVVESSILMPGAVVEEGAEVCYSIIAENAVIKKSARVGARPETVEDKAKWGVAVVARAAPLGKTPAWGPRPCWKKDVQDGEKLW